MISRFPVMIKRNSWCQVWRRHGVSYAVELKALAPEHLQRELDRAIRSMIDVDAYNVEIELEKTEAASLEGIKKHLLRAMQNYKPNPNSAAQ
jgi:hypothetical protein